MTTVDNTQPTVVVDAANHRVQVTVDTEVYPREAVFGAAYVFVDRCYVVLDAPASHVLTAELRGKGELDAEALDALAGEFFNELLSHTLRDMVCSQNQPLLTAVLGGVVAGAAGPAPALDVAALDALELDDEPFEDPLGIAMSWEEKYGNKRPSRKSAAGDTSTQDSPAKEG